MKVYKIQHRETGLFSNGGAYPRWTKTGKAWSGIGPLKSHLNLVLSERWPAAVRKDEHPYANANIVTFRYMQEDSVDVNEFLEGAK